MYRRAYKMSRKCHRTEVAVVRVAEKDLVSGGNGRVTAARGKEEESLSRCFCRSSIFTRWDYFDRISHIIYESVAFCLANFCHSRFRKTIPGAQLHPGEPDVHQRGGEMRAGVRRRATAEIRPGGLSRRRRLSSEQPAPLQRLQPGRAVLRPRRAGGLGRGWSPRGGLRGKRQGSKSACHSQRGHVSRRRKTHR